MQDNKIESKRVHKEIQPRDHTRNDHGIIEPEESPNNADATKPGHIHVINQLKENCREKISHYAWHSSTTRKPSIQCKLKKY